MSVDLSVEILGPRDRDFVIRLWAHAGLVRPWNNAEADYVRAINNSESDILGVRRDGEIVATAMVGHDGHRGWVYYVAVHDALRKRGFGRALMGAAEQWVSDRGIPKIQLMVRQENTSARAFYERLGYEDASVTVLGKRLHVASDET